jgi:hypothetical protein
MRPENIPSDATRARILPSLVITALTFVTWAPLHAQRPDQPALRVAPLTGALVLDGRMRESIWSTTDSAVLTEIEPVQGAIPRERTVVKVLASADVLVFGIRCDDADPRSITSFSRARDSDLSAEDHVRIVLDPFLNQEAGYVFEVNPNGARYDALISEQAQRLGGRENPNWDTIWEAATGRTADGWSVEIRIPVKSLLFKPGLIQWGFNVQRRVERNQQTQRWAYPNRDWRITQMSRAGLLTELPVFNLDRGFTARPALVLGSGIPAPTAPVENRATLSLDASQRFGSNTLASLTVNTDFAETEIDQRRTNLTRFDLFFPEKRSFFLEGTDIFDFGPGIAPDVLPFWSRRIGLFNGLTVPLEAGTKESGRLGETSFGVLAVRTGAVSGLVPATQMAVVRVKQNILGESSIGFIGTAGDPTGASGSWLAGADALLQTSHFLGDKNAVMGLWGLTMDRRDVTGSKSAGGVSLQYPNDLWSNALIYRWVGSGFQPSLGFVPRPGVQQLNLAVNYFPRPTTPWIARWLYQAGYELIGGLVTDLNGQWQTYRGRVAPINYLFQSGDRFDIAAHPDGDRLTAPFAIAPGDTIPPGTYNYMRYRVDYQIASKRRVSGGLQYMGGEFYNGRLSQYIGTLQLKPSPLFIVELTGERDQVRVVPKTVTVPFVLEQYGTRVRLNVSPDLEFNTFAQYDNTSHDFGTDARIRWTVRPGGDLFLTYNHNIDVGLPDRRWEFNSNELSVKVQYALRY